MSSSSTAVYRLQKDVKEVVQRYGYNSDNPPIFVATVEHAVDHVYALVIGPADTPYARCPYVFEFRCPSTYPNSPPEVRIVSTAFGTVRHNPNLYAGGKVCLSILGTWRGESGGSESWRSSYSLAYVLQAIQAMVLTSEPYHNEPGFDKDALVALTATGKCPTHAFGYKVAPSSSTTPTTTTTVVAGLTATGPLGGGGKSVSPESVAMGVPSGAPSPEAAAVSPTTTVGGETPTTSASPLNVPPKSPTSGKPGQKAALTDASPDPAGGGDETDDDDDDDEAASSSSKLVRQQPRRIVDPLTAARMRASVLAASEAYSVKIAHEAIRVGVCDMIEPLLGLTTPLRPDLNSAAAGSSAAQPNAPQVALPFASAFAPELKRQFLMNYECHLAAVRNPPARPLHAALAKDFPGQAPAVLRPTMSAASASSSPTSPSGGGVRAMSESAAAGAPYADGDSFDLVPFEGQGNTTAGVFAYKWLEARLVAIRAALDEETQRWIAEGVEETKKGSRAAFALQAEEERMGDIAGGIVCGGPEDGDENQFFWAVTLMPTEGAYADSAYIVDVAFHPTMLEPPRCRFRQPIWHPNVSADGVPFLWKEEASTYRPGAVLPWSPTGVAASLARLLTQPPASTPAAVLNDEAAAGAFSNDADKAKAFRRKARNLAQRTME